MTVFTKEENRGVSHPSIISDEIYNIHSLPEVDIVLHIVVHCDDLPQKKIIYMTFLHKTL